MTSGETHPEPVLSAEQLEAFMAEAFPQVNMDGRVYEIAAIEPGVATLTLDPNERHLRPGGTVSGPTLFTLCDYAAYAVILGHIGPVALAVTTNLSINFLRKPEPGRLVCQAELLKLGKRLVVIACHVRDHDGRLVAEAHATYSIPPR